MQSLHSPYFRNFFVNQSQYYHMDELRLIKHLLELKEMIQDNHNELQRIKAKMEGLHPEFHEITRTQAAQVLNCSIQKIDKMLKAGLLDSNGSGLLKYDSVIRHKKYVPNHVPQSV